MKKKIILFGSILAAFLMLMIPSISAVNTRDVTETLDEAVLTCSGGQTDGPSLFQIIFGIIFYGLLKKEVGEHPVLERIIFGNPQLQ
ncbi:MAG: hypothetical protein JSW62_01950 [Thermoplasmatales archaeon]|nr:MAG: hypothetical protein JSW62_01950 [Thermoplasmatales archaeon]